MQGAEERSTVARVRHEIPRTPGVAARGATFAFCGMVAFAVAGCSLALPWRGRSPEPEPQIVEAPPEPEPGEGVHWRVGFVETLLARGEAHLGSGALPEAESAFEDALYWIEIGDPLPLADHARRARWGLALTYLLSDDATRAERTRQLLAELADQEGAVDAVFARWITSTLEEVRRLRNQVAAQQDVIRTLNETVEQLKQIDLTRRPAGSAAPEGTPAGSAGPVP